MSAAQRPRRYRRPPSPETPLDARDGEVRLWTDGACSGNPGPAAGPP